MTDAIHSLIAAYETALKGDPQRAPLNRSRRAIGILLLAGAAGSLLTVFILDRQSGAQAKETSVLLACLCLHAALSVAPQMAGIRWLGRLLTLIVTKPLLRLHVAARLQKILAALRWQEARSQTAPPSPDQFLDKLEKLVGTLPKVPSLLKLSVPPIASALITYLSQRYPIPPSQAVVFVISLLVLCGPGFSQKRQLMTQANAYTLERQVFADLHNPTPQEFQWDFFGRIILACMGVIAAGYALLIPDAHNDGSWWTLFTDDSTYAKGAFLITALFIIGIHISEWRTRVK